jgi:3-oxoacyl-[acyl-carrier protein] reductase
MSRALVFGGSSGLGLACARALREAGHDVAIAARGEARLARAADELGVSTLQADLSQAGAARSAVEAAGEALGGVDVLLTNQGGPPKATAASLTREQLLDAFQLVTLGAIEAIQAALPGMLERGHGRILCLTSIAAKEPVPGLALSNTVRAGLHGYAKTLAGEVAGGGVTVNCLLPGYTRTQRLEELGIDLDTIAAQIPVGEIPEPTGLAALAAFLASDEARHITGQSFCVDGGVVRSLF